MGSDPNIWTAGSRGEDLDAFVGVAGAGAFVRSVPWVFDDRVWWHAQDLDLNEDASLIVSMVPGSLSNCAAGGVLGSYPCSAGVRAGAYGQ